MAIKPFSVLEVIRRMTHGSSFRGIDREISINTGEDVFQFLMTRVYLFLIEVIFKFVLYRITVFKKTNFITKNVLLLRLAMYHNYTAHITIILCIAYR